MNPINDVIVDLADNTPRPGRLCPLLKQDDNTLHVGISAGMGNFELTPIEDCKPLLADAIKQLYETENLVPSGKARSIYPGDDLFIRLVYKE